jgi:YHS domain-containing protein
MTSRLATTLLLFVCVVGTARGETPQISADGYCLVTTVDSDVWIKGEPLISSDYRARRFLFLSGDEKAKFERTPERYAPMLDGNDPILACDNDLIVPGKRKFAMRHKDRTFFFALREHMDKFDENAGHYFAMAKMRQGIEDKIRLLELKRGKPASSDGAPDQTGK